MVPEDLRFFWNTVVLASYAIELNVKHRGVMGIPQSNWEEPPWGEKKREEEKDKRQKDFFSGQKRPEFYGWNVFTDFLPPVLFLWPVFSQKNRNIIQQIPQGGKGKEGQVWGLQISTSYAGSWSGYVKNHPGCQHRAPAPAPAQLLSNTSAPPAQAQLKIISQHLDIASSQINSINTIPELSHWWCN